MCLCDFGGRKWSECLFDSCGLFSGDVVRLVKEMEEKCGGIVDNVWRNTIAN